MNRKIVLIVVLSTVLLLALPAMAASSGIVIITQADVTKGSIPGTNGASGFPVTITHSGSYQLGSNLVVPDGVDGIDVNAADVTLDLNGFAMRGPVSCTGKGSGLTCSGAAASGGGIFSSRSNLTVRNGKVSGFSTVGVDLEGDGSVVDSVSVSENTWDGIVVLNGLITNCTASRNGATVLPFAGNGIVAGSSQVKGNTAIGNFRQGFSLTNSGATDNVAVGNGLAGFAAFNSLISNSVSTSNGGGDFQNLGGLTSANNNMCSGVLC